MASVIRFVKSMALLFAIASASVAYAQIPEWTLSEAAGTVSISQANGATHKAARGAILNAGDAVVTGIKSRAIIVRGQEYVTIAANTKISIAIPRQGSKVQIVQTRGNAVYKIQKKATAHFSTQTPFLAAVVKGTTFSVTVGAAGASVQVTEGAVQVQPSIGDASFIILPGMIGTVQSKTPSRLGIVGTITQVIESSEESLNVTSDADPTPIFEPAQDRSGESKSVATESVIKSAIAESGVRLADLSGGLVSGNSVAGMPGASSDDASKKSGSSLADDSPQATTIAIASSGDSYRSGGGNNSNNGRGNGNSGGSDNSYGNVNSGSGTGNGNSGPGSDNGNSGSGSDNGNSGSGSGNGNGGSGNGNGNNGNGNGNGGSGSGSGSSGNGNGGSGSSNGGSGNGNRNNGNGNGGRGPG